MMRFAFGLLLTILLTSGALAERRVALVIGNSAYQHTPKLANPKNDAADTAAALRKHGLQVIEAFDLDKATFERKVRDFSAALSGADAGVFFYAGHGLQVGGQNYLVPIDAQLSSASALDFEMVRLDFVQKTMEREARTNILFIDACRDNPLARNLAKAMGTRSLDIRGGLAPAQSGVGTLISFSTQPGNVASDGSGRNSPFTEALVKHILMASDDLNALLISVRNDVIRRTQGEQVPWEHSALRERFYFTPFAAGKQPLSVSPIVTGYNLSGSWFVRSVSCEIAGVQLPGGSETYEVQVVQSGNRITGEIAGYPGKLYTSKINGSVDGHSFAFVTASSFFLGYYSAERSWNGTFVSPTRITLTLKSLEGLCTLEGLKRQ